MKLVKMPVLIVLTAVVFSTCGCLDFFKSLFQLHTKDTLIFKPSLVGTWKKERLEDYYDDGFDGAYSVEEINSAERYIFYKEEDSYRVERINDEGKITLLKVYLVKVGDNYFLDIFPHEDQERPEGEECFALTHMITKINFKNDHLIEMCLFKKNLKWMEKDDDKMSSVEKDLVATSEIEMVLTHSSTKEVHEFLEKYGEDAFSKFLVMRFEKVD